jgi:hypothetical protein
VTDGDAAPDPNGYPDCGPHPDAGTYAPLRALHAGTRTIWLVIQAPAWGPHPQPYPKLCDGSAAGGVILQVEWPRVLLPEERAAIEVPWVLRHSRDEGLSYEWHDWPPAGGTTEA